MRFSESFNVSTKNRLFSWRGQFIVGGGNNNDNNNRGEEISYAISVLDPHAGIPGSNPAANL